METDLVNGVLNHRGVVFQRILCYISAVFPDHLLNQFPVLLQGHILDANSETGGNFIDIIGMDAAVFNAFAKQRV